MAHNRAFLDYTSQQPPASIFSTSLSTLQHNTIVTYHHSFWYHKIVYPISFGQTLFTWTQHPTRDIVRSSLQITPSLGSTPFLSIPTREFNHSNESFNNNPPFNSSILLTREARKSTRNIHPPSLPQYPRSNHPYLPGPTNIDHGQRPLTQHLPPHRRLLRPQHNMAIHPHLWSGSKIIYIMFLLRRDPRRSLLLGRNLHTKPQVRQRIPPIRMG